MSRPLRRSGLSVHRLLQYIALIAWALWSESLVVASKQQHQRSDSKPKPNNPSRTGKPKPKKAKAASLYEVLGASKTSTPEQIKKCYRKACLQHHPDKGGDEDTFKEVARAYQVLSDPQQRQLYDRLGEAGIDPSGNGGTGPSSGAYSTSFDPNVFGRRTAGPGAESFFAQAFGGGPAFRSFAFNDAGPSSSFFSGAQSPLGESPGVPHELEDLLHQMGMGGMGGSSFSSFSGGTAGRRQPVNNHPPVYERSVSCTLEELYRGTTKKLKVSLAPAQSRVYSLTIRPGYKAGTKLTFPATAQFPVQMVFAILEDPHPNLQRRGDDLVYRHRLAREGAATRNAADPVELVVPLLDGTTWRRHIPANSSLLRAGQSLTVPDMGMPIRKPGTKDTSVTNAAPARGNLIIEFY